MGVVHERNVLQMYLLHACIPHALCESCLFVKRYHAFRSKAMTRQHSSSKALHYMHLLSKFKAVKQATLACLAILSNHKNAHCIACNYVISSSTMYGRS